MFLLYRYGRWVGLGRAEQREDHAGVELVEPGLQRQHRHPLGLAWVVRCIRVLATELSYPRTGAARRAQVQDMSAYQEMEDEG
jgi:hypothetical protein